MEINYEALGFKCGLEIHQQLEGKKLFCNCLTLNSDKEPNVKVERKLRAVAGETGEIDIAAQHEMSKNRRFVYESSSEDTCLVEYDEEPPHGLNKEALETALKVALLLNAKIVDEIQVMRKTVIDGSNVSGFQRTALIAMDGFIETSHGKVSIPTICLEEEAAQKIWEGKDFVKYRLDRLGIPLVEIATGTEIKNPEHAKEVASHIGMILRSVEGVKRGLGTIRQDVNISIRSGARTEIKGFQELKIIPKIIEYEVKRQIEQVKEGKKLVKEVRKAEPDFTTSFLRPMPGAARLYPETDVLPVKIDELCLDRLKKQLPKLLSHKISDFEEKYNLSKDLAKEVIDNEFFEKLTKKFPNIEPMMIANTLVVLPKDVKKRLNADLSNLKYADYEEVLSYLDSGKISREAIPDLLIRKSNGEEIALDIKNYSPVSMEELEKEIVKIIHEKPNLNLGAYMGLMMAKHRGRVEGRKIVELLKRYIE